MNLTAKILIAGSALFAASCEAIEQPPETPNSEARPLSFVTPTKPNPTKVPKQNILGKEIRGPKIPATVVFSFSLTETYALHGFVVTNGQTAVDTFFWNDGERLYCASAAERSGYGEYTGPLVCKQGDADFLEGPIGFSGEQPAVSKGTLAGGIGLEGGERVKFRIEWDINGFPTASRVASKLLGSGNTVRDSPRSKMHPLQMAYEDMEG